MDPVKLFELLKTGGPLAISAVVLFIWWLERKGRKEERDRNIELESQLLDLSIAQTEAVTKFDATLSSLKEYLLSRE